MKLYDKKELTFRKGMLVTKDGDALRIAEAITEQANALETKMQEQMFLKDQPEATPAPTLDGFERKSIAKKKIRVKCATPLLDEKIKKAEAFMDELDAVDNANKVESTANKFIDLIEFAEDDFVLADVCGEPSVFDTPMLGNPLDYDCNLIMAAISLATGLTDVDLSKIIDNDVDCDCDCDRERERDVESE
jgi:hypothetical protein